MTLKKDKEIDNFSFTISKRQKAKDTIHQSSLHIENDEPDIEYREVIIDGENLNLYRTGKQLFIGGCMDEQEDKIIIYRYKLSDNIKLNPKIKFDNYFIEKHKCKDSEARIVEHEKKHWRNKKFGVKEEIISNLLELSLSYAFDEISAFSQSNLYGVPSVTEEEAQHALMMGIRDFIEVAPFYLDMHFEKVLFVALLRKSMGTLKDEDFIPFVIDYSVSFQRLVKNYLTFGNICCYDMKKGYYANEINQNLFAIKYKYKEKISQITKNSLNKLFLERRIR